MILRRATDAMSRIFRRGAAAGSGRAYGGPLLDGDIVGTTTMRQRMRNTAGGVAGAARYGGRKALKYGIGGGAVLGAGIVVGRSSGANGLRGQSSGGMGQLPSQNQPVYDTPVNRMM